jgi:hypothetical protein
MHYKKEPKETSRPEVKFDKLINKHYNVIYRYKY